MTRAVATSDTINNGGGFIIARICSGSGIILGQPLSRRTDGPSHRRRGSSSEFLFEQRRAVGQAERLDSVGAAELEDDVPVGPVLQAVFAEVGVGAVEHLGRGR